MVRVSLERELQILKNLLVDMSKSVDEMITGALKAIENLDPNLANKVIRFDEQVDYYEHMVTLSAVEIIALQQPVAKDLRFIISAFDIARNLERLADQAVNIAERVPNLVEQKAPPLYKCETSIQPMAKEALFMLESAINAFISEDVQKAHAVIKHDDIVDSYKRENIKILKECMRNDPNLIDIGVEYIIVVQNLERIGDHACNIAEAVIFTVEGKTPKLERLEPVSIQEILTKEAIDAAESSPVRLVRGVAGSGKSLVLIHRVHYLAETYPELSVLAITFNKHLAERLRARIEIELPQVEVSTFHQLCVRVIKDSGEAWHSPIRRDGFLQGYVRDTRAAQALGVEFLDAEIGWRKDVGLLDNTAYLAAERKGRGKALDRNGRAIVNAAWDAYRDYQNRLAISRQAWRDWEDVGSEALRLLEKTDHRLKHSYDVILIDEAQDFAPVWIQTIKYLLKPNGTLFICDDPTQSIFRQYSWEEKGVSVRGRTKLLTVPYRCTRQITELAYSVIQHDSVLKQMADEIVSPNIDSPFVLSGDVPHLAPCRNEAETVARTHDYVEEWAGRGVAYEQIAVLCPSKAVVKYFAELREKGVYVENFEKVKGLEFQAVVIPFLCRAFGREGEQHNDEEISHKRRMLFTAMTRARILLAMTHQGALPPMLESIRPYVFIRV